MVELYFGSGASRAAPATAEALARYGRSFLSYGPDLPLIFAAADADPGSALANAHAAIVHMALEAASGHRAARPYLARAQAAALRDEERLLVAAAEDWAAGRFDRCLARHLELARLCPEDLVTAKWGQYHAFNLGRSAAMLELAEAVRPVHDTTPYFQGMRAFALEQCHRLEEAEAAVWRALEIEPVDPWAHHALAHILETEGRREEGLALLEGFAPSWADRGVFIRGHNWWHVALFHLEGEDFARALEVFDQRLWGIYPEFSQEQVGAISALWRLELKDVDVGGRWHPVAAKVAERELEHLQPFLDLHYLYALARAGRDREADRFLASMGAHAARVAPGLAPAWRGVALGAAEGVIAHARRRYDAAFEALNGVIRDIQAIGGSHAQRDLFQETWLDAMIRTGRLERAGAVIAERARRRRGTPAMLRWLARVGGPGPAGLVPARA